MGVARAVRDALGRPHDRAADSVRVRVRRNERADLRRRFDGQPRGLVPLIGLCPAPHRGVRTMGDRVSLPLGEDVGRRGSRPPLVPDHPATVAGSTIGTHQGRRGRGFRDHRTDTARRVPHREVGNSHRIVRSAVVPCRRPRTVDTARRDGGRIGGRRVDRPGPACPSPTTPLVRWAQPVHAKFARPVRV